MILNMTGGGSGVQTIDFTVTENYTFDAYGSGNYYVIPNVDIPAGGIKGFLLEPIANFGYQKNYILMIASQHLGNNIRSSEDLWYIYYDSDTVLADHACSYYYNGFIYDSSAKEVKIKCQEGSILQAANYRLVIW